MLSQRSRGPMEPTSREIPDRAVTFTASSSGANSKKVTGQPAQGSSAPSSGPPSRRGPSHAPESPGAESAALSLRGLLAAQRLTRELKNRTSARTASRLQRKPQRPVSIVQEQVPWWSAWLEAKFPCAQAETLMQAHLSARLAGVTYHPVACARLAVLLSAEIRELVKAVTPPRYRLLCTVSIGSRGQDVLVCSQSLWDPHTDSFAACHYVGPTLFCVALVHAVFRE